MILALRCGSKEQTSPPSLPVLAHGHRRRHTSDGDAEAGWSPPDIACQSVLPTRALMRTNGTRRAGRERSPLRVFSQRKHFHELLAKVGPSRSGEGRGQPHLSIAWLAEHKAQAKGWQGRARDDEPRSCDGLGFPWLPASNSAHAGSILDNPLEKPGKPPGSCKSVFLPPFGSPRAWRRPDMASVPSSCIVKALPPIWPRSPPLAHWKAAIRLWYLVGG
jgi:hypothetical protein